MDLVDEGPGCRALFTGLRGLDEEASLCEEDATCSTGCRWWLFWLFEERVWVGKGWDVCLAIPGACKELPWVIAYLV